MGLVTKKGDKGRTSLYLGGLVAKDSPRIELVGALDELSAFLGMAKGCAKKKAFRDALEGIQRDLACLATEAVTPLGAAFRLKRRIGHRDVARLEALIEACEDRAPRICSGFVIPGSTKASGLLDVCRTVARRAERRAVTLARLRKLGNKDFLVYLNRVSDLLYLLARSCEARR